MFSVVSTAFVTFSTIVIFNPSLIRKDFHREWHLYVKTRSLENRIPVISINSISDDFMGEAMRDILWHHEVPFSWTARP